MGKSLTVVNDSHIRVILKVVTNSGKVDGHWYVEVVKDICTPDPR